MLILQFHDLFLDEGPRRILLSDLADGSLVDYADNMGRDVIHDFAATTSVVDNLLKQLQIVRVQHQ